MHPNYEYISSRSNALIVSSAKLSDKKHRESEHSFAFEGIKLLDEALKRDLPLTNIFVTERNQSLLDRITDKKNIRCTLVSDSVYEKLTNENSPQGVFCISKYLDNLHKFATIYNNDFRGTYFCVSGVRDPGNMGTIMRTAMALGVDTLVISNDCADIYNPKTVRASMGAVFTQKTLRVADMPSALRALSGAGYKVLAAALDSTALSFYDLKTDEKTCFVVGNEGSGLSSEEMLACTGKVYIPMHKSCESLNVATSASIFMWELSKSLKN